MKKILFLTILAASLFLAGCGNFLAQANYNREAKAAKYQSEYAVTVNKLEMKEGNFKTYRRVVFYNVRLGETVFTCEGYCHVQVDRDGDIELVVKTGEDEYLRHYLGQKQDITYFSEQLKPVKQNDYRYKIIWNPKIWLPELE
ncbi:hypothetical protein [Treponema zioleckii]|uniref:beta-sandwich lipoprotein n=1 Tax=Treponema zioleckii TaxID=331680 RepID=UPI00168AB1AD|nr:hypothetical protein [Treponema zioleckii]